MAHVNSPKRSTAQKEADLDAIAQMKIRGLDVREIARILSEDPTRPYTVSKSQVMCDVKKIYTRWKENSLEYVQAGKELACASLDAVEREAWEGWDKSKKDATRKTVKKISAGGTGGDGKTEQQIQTEAQNGDPKFLELVVQCVEKRARILGVEAPQKLDVPMDLNLPTPTINLVITGAVNHAWPEPVPG